jgi:hypothetical protein
VLRQLDQRRCDELRDRASELFRGDPAGMIVAAVSASPDPAQRRRSARMTRRFAAALVALLFTVIASSSIGHRPTAWTSVMHQLRRWSTGVHIPGTGSHTHRGY